jgi:hypothetical protein
LGLRGYKEIMIEIGRNSWENGKLIKKIKIKLDYRMRIKYQYQYIYPIWDQNYKRRTDWLKLW